MLETFPLDISVFNAIHGLSGVAPLLDALGIFLALYLPFIMGLAVVVFAFKQGTTKRKWGTFLTLLLVVLVSRGLITEIIRFAYPVARPFAALGFTPLIGESGASFPSAHAAFFFALSFALLAFDRKWGYWFLGLSLVNGIARIYVGVHYPMDILGGIAVGFVSYLIVKYLLKPERFKTAPPPVQEMSDAEEAAPREIA